MDWISITVSGWQFFPIIRKKKEYLVIREFFLKAKIIAHNEEIEFFEDFGSLTLANENGVMKPLISFISTQIPYPILHEIRRACHAS